MPRIARLLAINYPHHITQRGNNKETVFFDEEDRKSYLKILKKYSDQWNFDVWAYCLMPNHIHILAVPRKEESFAKGIGATNLVYPVVALNSALGFIKPLPIEERPLNQCHLLDQSIGDPVE